jgi:hypothetical protein
MGSRGQAAKNTGINDTAMTRAFILSAIASFFLSLIQDAHGRWALAVISVGGTWLLQTRQSAPFLPSESYD